ncbi:hypothetical protein [Paenibacillus lentus]|nr:hypothetical protein [Paenibacillus lentus]
MPHHKSTKIKDQQNKSSIMEEVTEPKMKKQAKRPPSLNEVPKM